MSHSDIFWYALILHNDCITSTLDQVYIGHIHQHRFVVTVVLDGDILQIIHLLVIVLLLRLLDSLDFLHMLLPFLKQKGVSLHFFLVNVFRQEIGQKYAIVTCVLHFINCQIGEAVGEGDG